MRKNILYLLLPLASWLSATLSTQAATRTQKEGIGVVLSGGAARGFAHIGALQALEDRGIIPTYVSGASMGAVIGSIYAAGVQPHRIYSFAREQNYLRLYRPSLHGALFRTTFLSNMLNKLIPYNNTFQSLEKKMFVCVTNLNTGTYHIIDSGLLKPIVVASASIPFFFEPSIIDSTTYVDGGLVNNLPVEPLLERCKYVIGISVNAISHAHQSKLTGMEGAQRVLTIAVANTEMERSKKCHFFIEIREADRHGLLDFNRVEEFYNIGYAAVESYLKEHPEMLRLAKEVKR